MSSLTHLQEKPKWQLDSSVNSCNGCNKPFSITLRKHHCRACGKIFCGDCNSYKLELTSMGYVGLQSVCKSCKVSIETDVTLNELFLMGARGAPRKLLADVKSVEGEPQIFSMVTNTEEGASIFKDEVKRRLFGFILKDTITHPYIITPSFAQLRDTKAVVIKPYQQSGSIKDLIYITDEMKKKKIGPKSKFIEKYSSPQGKPLSITQIQRYGRQILEALFYLYLHGYPYPHLHSGNVLITENDHAQISDLENTLLVLDPCEIKGIQKVLASNPDASPEVIAFGLLLFEMAMGFEKEDHSLKDVKNKCPPEIFPILESILESNENPASLKSLLRHPFFQEVQLDVTIHQVVLTEKWDDRVRSLLKLIRAATARILTPPATPTLRSSGSSIQLGTDSIASHSSSSPSISHSRQSSHSRVNSLTKKKSTKSVAPAQSNPSSSSNSSVSSPSIPSPPAPPKAGPAPPPPPPPPSVAKSMPSPQNGRDDLMASIRAAGGLKSIKKN